jgi:hypothetical protein
MSALGPVPPLETVRPTTPRKSSSWRWWTAGGVVVLLVLLWQCGSAIFEARSLSYPAVAAFHAHLNSGEYGQICNEADEEFAPEGKRDKAVQFFDALHRKLGEAGASNLTNINVTRNTKGTFVTAIFSTHFAEGEGQEKFTWKKNERTLKLYSYNVSSPELVQ